MNDAIFAALAGDTPASARAAEAVNAFTRDKLWRLRHIPNRYFLDPALAAQLAALTGEIKAHGYVALDADGEPAVLSGKPPKIPHDPEPS